jgi:signal transduction histidine kinase
MSGKRETDLRARYEAERRRLEQRRLAAGERDRNRSAPLEDRLAAALARFEQRSAELTARADRAAGDGAEQPSPAAGLPVAALHHLAELDSLLRHSVVEASFYNLRVLAELAAEQGASPTELAGFAEAVESLGLVREELERYFATHLHEGRTVGEVFGEAAAAARSAFAGLESLVAATPVSPGEVVAATDEVLGALGGIKDAVGARRLNAAEIAGVALGLMAGKLREAGIESALLDRTGSPALVFGHRGGLVSAIGECLRNVAKHAFGAGQVGERRATLELEFTDPERSAVRVTVADNGRGVPAELLGRLGTRGAATSESGEGLAMVKHIVEVQHRGAFSVEDAQPGARVVITLPCRL